MLNSVKRLAMSLAMTSIGLTGCYVVPINKEGAYSVYPAGQTPVMQAPVPTTLNVRLYPANDVASRSGMLLATVTSNNAGKGRFQLNYQGETLNGEATRSGNNDRNGIANAYAPSGTFLSCEYQMTSAAQGNGECVMSDGARYKAHIGG